MRTVARWISLFAGIVAASVTNAAVLTYDVVTTFYEPDTQPNNSIFTGSFQFDDVTGEVSGLHGLLSESMTGMMGGGMTLLPLTHQLSSVYDAALGGLLVATFLDDSTNTLSTMGGGDGWAPGSGYGLHYDFPGPNPGNAYVRIFVDTTNPLAPLTQAQIDHLAYADCAPGGMMGATCMTSTSVAATGTIGTMSGTPLSQTITLAIPEPGTGLLLLAGAGVLASIRRGRRSAH